MQRQQEQLIALQNELKTRQHNKHKGYNNHQSITQGVIDNEATSKIHTLSSSINKITMYSGTETSNHHHNKSTSSSRNKDSGISPSLSPAINNSHQHSNRKVKDIYI